MNADLQIALVGLGGVIVGAGITSGFSYAIERRKERTAVRRAARLIDADLMSAVVAAQTCLEDKAWWSKTTPLTTGAWQQHRDVIASELAWGDWLAVMVAVESITALQVARDGALAIQLATLAADHDKADVVAAAEHLGIDIVHPAPAIPEDDAVLLMIEPMFRRLVAGRTALAPMTQDA